MQAGGGIVADSTAAGEYAESFHKMRGPLRAIELAEGTVENDFLMAFSRPVRDAACDCAREEEPSLNEVLHLPPWMNGWMVSEAERCGLDAAVMLLPPDNRLSQSGTKLTALALEEAGHRAISHWPGFAFRLLEAILNSRSPDAVEMNQRFTR